MSDLILKQEETRRVLGMLRRKRIANGGSGAPLQMPGGKEVSPIIITDEDLNAQFTDKSIFGD